MQLLKTTMKTTTMRTAMLYAAIVSTVTFAANAQNANVTWQTPGNITGASDVSLAGTLFGTWAPGNDWGGNNYADLFPVNDVTFHAYGTGGVNFNFADDNLNLD